MNEIDMNDLARYSEILNDCFDKPPKNVPEVWMKLLSRYPVNIVSISLDDKIIGFVTVTNLSSGIYGIEWTVISPEHQGKGYGSRLMEKVHSMYDGIFIVKTRNASGFYKKLGYTEVYNDGAIQILSYINKVVYPNNKDSC